MTFCELPLWEICIPRILQAEEILIGCFVECQSIKKVGGRRSVEELYQALFFVSPVPPECFTERNENRAWSQVIDFTKPINVFCLDIRYDKTKQQWFQQNFTVDPRHVWTETLKFKTTWRVTFSIFGHSPCVSWDSERDFENRKQISNLPHIFRNVQTWLR